MKWLIRGAYNLGVLAWGSLTDIGNYLRIRFIAILISVGVLACLGSAIVLPRIFPATMLLTFYMGALLLIGLLLGIIFLIAFDRLAETLAFIIQENLVLKHALDNVSNELKRNGQAMGNMGVELNHLKKALDTNAESTSALTEQMGRAEGKAISN